MQNDRNHLKTWKPIKLKKLGTAFPFVFFFLFCLLKNVAFDKILMWFMSIHRVWILIGFDVTFTIHHIWESWCMNIIVSNSIQIKMTPGIHSAKQKAKNTKMFNTQCSWRWWCRFVLFVRLSSLLNFFLSIFAHAFRISHRNRIPVAANDMEKKRPVTKGTQSK